MNGKYSLFFLVACSMSLAVPGTIVKRKIAVEQETKQENEKYVRLWVDTKEDKYMRLGINSKSIKYYNIGLFGSKTDICELALWGVVNQVGQMQQVLNMERQKNGKPKSNRHRKGKRPPRPNPTKSK